MLDRQTLIMLLIGICIVNGIFSPYLKVAVPVSAALMPELFPRTIEWILFWGSILLSSATLLFSGVPAALYERLIDRDPASDAFVWIWLVGAAVLSLPAILRFF